ncbi:MAG: adenosine deaminase [Planctomycetota bacterium]|nr:MAG: adenosine deaminase [Planctomycetota bacterium]
MRIRGIPGILPLASGAKQDGALLPRDFIGVLLDFRCFAAPVFVSGAAAFDDNPQAPGDPLSTSPSSSRPKHDPTLSRELVAALPKSDLHVHLDGSLRLETLIELARERKVKLPSTSPSGLKRLVFKQAYENLPEYLKGFEYTVACLSDPEALERAAFELAEDAAAENCCYLELRFAPQLHVRDGFGLGEVMAAVAKGLRRAERRINSRAKVRKGEMPPLRSGIIVCAMRFFNEHFSEHYRAYFRALPLTGDEEIFSLASQELAKATVQARDQGLPIVGIDLAGQERGYPAESHAPAYQIAHRAFLGKTVHAGEDYGPESIFQAITHCHADRIGHGTWLFSGRRIQDPSIRDKQGYIDALARYVADRRITLEVCLTSNQQTLPEFREDLRKHPYAKMRKARLSTTFCTDNRLVSNTTVSDEIWKAVTVFGLQPRELKNQLVYGFKRSFFPGPYLEKRAYVRQVIDRIDAVMAEFGVSTDHPV